MKFNEGERLVPIGSVKPYEKNPRIHSQEQISLLAKHMEQVGFDTPIVVDEDMVIIKGHGRLAALKELGQSQALIKQVTGLTEAQKRSARIADNKIQGLATDHRELLKTELSWLSGLHVDLRDIGYENIELKIMDIDLSVTMPVSDASPAAQPQSVADDGGLHDPAPKPKEMAAHLDGYLDARIRKISFVMDYKDYERCVLQLDKYQVANGLQSHSEALIRILDAISEDQ